MYLTHKEVEILEYCYPHVQQMWASTIMGIILGCDFRDAQMVWEQYRDHYVRF